MVAGLNTSSVSTDRMVLPKNIWSGERDPVSAGLSAVIDMKNQNTTPLKTRNATITT